MNYVNKLFRWERGRLNTGYEVMVLGTVVWPFKFDICILRLKAGSEIPLHTDPVSSGKHYRLNISVKSARMGGEFVCDRFIYKTKRIIFLRPDISEHEITRVTKGTKYLFSLGWVTN